MVVLGLTLPRIWRTAVIGTLVVAAVPLVALNWERLMSFKRDKELSAAEAAESAKLRPILAVIAWHMFLDRPLLGSGYGQYRTESLAYLSDRSTDLPLEKARPYVQHNVFLALAGRYGPGRNGAVHRDAGALAADGLAVVAQPDGAARRRGSSACCFWRLSASGFPTPCFRMC